MTSDDIRRFWSKVERGPGCWLWVAKSKDWDGYGLFKVRGRSLRAHRVAWQLATGAAPGAALVCHRCDTPACVRPEHLFIGSPADNFRDCLAKGRYSPKGTGNAAAKLDDAKVQEIRQAYGTGEWSQEGLARRFGVTQTAISAVVRRTKWRHVHAA